MLHPHHLQLIVFACSLWSACNSPGPIDQKLAHHFDSHGGVQARCSCSCDGGLGGGDGHGGGSRRGVRPQRPLPLPACHPRCSPSSPFQAVLPCGADRGQDLHVQPAQVILLPCSDGAQWTAAAQQVRPHRSARLPLRTSVSHSLPFNHHVLPSMERFFLRILILLMNTYYSSLHVSIHEPTVRLSRASILASIERYCELFESIRGDLTENEFVCEIFLQVIHFHTEGRKRRSLSKKT